MLWNVAYADGVLDPHEDMLLRQIAGLIHVPDKECGRASNLLFTDIVMPGMNGRQLAEAALKIKPQLKVLYTTGYTRNAIVHNGMLDPGIALLPKPFALHDLAVKVRQMLDGGV